MPATPGWQTTEGNGQHARAAERYINQIVPNQEPCPDKHKGEPARLTLWSQGLDGRGILSWV